MYPDLELVASEMPMTGDFNGVFKTEYIVAGSLILLAFVILMRKKN